MIDLRVNGKWRSVDAEPDTPLLYVLRDDLALEGPKFGCGLAQCGACAILRDGVEIRSCDTPVSVAAGHEIVPEMRVSLLDRPNDPPAGAGELGGTAMTAAIGNAIFDATGKRSREAPFTPAGIRAALA